MASSLTEEQYKELIEYLRSTQRGKSIYPLGFTTNQKRGLRQQAACFEDKDGALFHSSTDSGAERKRLHRVVVAVAEKNRLIQACYDGIDGGHYGRDKTLSMVHDVTIDVLIYCNHARDLCNTITHYLPSLQLIESYWWKGMASDVSEYCKRCQRVKNRLGRAKVELHPIPVTDVWKQIGIDLIGKFYMYILGLVFGVIGSFITPAFF